MGRKFGEILGVQNLIVNGRRESKALSKENINEGCQIRKESKLMGKEWYNHLFKMNCCMPNDEKS